MSTLDLSPAPGAAPFVADGGRARPLLEAKLLLRNGEQLVLALVIPLGLRRSARRSSRTSTATAPSGSRSRCPAPSRSP